MKNEYSKGFIKIWRNIVHWDWWHDVNTSRLWLVILLNANWQDNEWRGIEIKRGSMLTSIERLATMSQLTIQQTRTALKHLEKTNDITIKSTNKYSIITIVNYDVWQGDFEKLTSETTSKVTNEPTIKPTSQITTNKETNNNKNIKNNKNNYDVDLMELLTVEQIQAIYRTYENAGDLIDIVQDQVNSKGTEIKSSAYSYICGYANNTNWRTIEEVTT